MGFPLDRGSVEDGTLTCHWHHARFDLASGCTFDLWADDVPTCPAEVRDGEVWVRPIFGHLDPAAHWCQRLDDGLAHVLGLVIAKAVHGQLAAGVPPPDIVRQIALFGIQNRDGWGVGLTILTALGNLLPVLPEEETYLALFHGARRVAADCDGQAPRRRRAALASRPDLATLKRWLRRWTTVRHREVQLERRVAVSPWLNEDVQDLAFAVHGPPDEQLSAVDGDEHFVEMPPPVRPRPSSSQLARNDPAELQSPAADRLDATLGKHILDVAVAQSEAEIEPDGLLDDDARKAVAAV